MIYTDTNAAVCTTADEEIIETVEADEEAIEVYTEEEFNTFEIMTFDELRAMIFGNS